MLGIERKTLVFDSGKLAAAVANMSETIKDKIRLLKGELLSVYSWVVMDVGHQISTIIIAPRILIIM